MLLAQAFLEEAINPGPAKTSFLILGGATRPAAEGIPLLEEIVRSSTTCKGIQGHPPE
jgi:hypothetical protein